MALKIFLYGKELTFPEGCKLEWNEYVPGPSVVNKDNQVIAHFYSIDAWLLTDDFKAAPAAN